MEIRESWIKACSMRKSRRTYIEKDIEKDKLNKLQTLIDEINKETNLNIQLVSNHKNGISGFKASYGMISGAKAFIALVANKNIKNYKQQIGYYGEAILLEAISIGLSTCWIGGTYSKKECEKVINIKDNEELICVISIGYAQDVLSIKEKLVKQLNKKDKSVDDILISKYDNTKPWILAGAEFALDAPSALNKKPIVYEYENEVVKAKISKANYGYEEVDLGISMLHFEIGATSYGHKGKWEYKLGSYIYS